MRRIDANSWRLACKHAQALQASSRPDPEDEAKGQAGRTGTDGTVSPFLALSMFLSFMPVSNGRRHDRAGLIVCLMHCRKFYQRSTSWVLLARSFEDDASRWKGKGRGKGKRTGFIPLEPFDVF